MKFHCACCQNDHDLQDLSLGAAAPFHWEVLSPEDRANSELGQEDCVISTSQGMTFYIRACLDVPRLNAHELASFSL